MGDWMDKELSRFQVKGSCTVGRDRNLGERSRGNPDWAVAQKMKNIYTIMVIKLTGLIARMEECMSALKILTGKPTEKRPLERSRCRWEINIRMDLKEIGINTRNWVDSTRDRNYWRALVNVSLNLRVPLVMELVS